MKDQVRRMDIIVMTAFGLESVTAKELRNLGYHDLSVETGRIVFQGDAEAVVKTNLWLRTADRVLIRVGSFPAMTFTELFDGTKALPWGDWLSADSEFPVIGKSIRSQLFSVSDCQAIVKKAVVDKLKEKYHQSWFDETGARYRIEIGMLNDEATLTIDTTGTGLHKRGYRTLVSTAPLRETLAAGIILLSGWQWERPFLDPFCGSGTIPVEAAMIGLNMAPGINRAFAAEQWHQIPKDIWDTLRQEARDVMASHRDFRILGSDMDGDVLNLARFHSEKAGVQDKVFFQKLPMAEIRSRKKYGYLVTNPPYGERLGDPVQIEGLYKEMGRVFQSMDTWSYYILSAHPAFETLFGRKADKRRKLYNGMIPCQLFQYYGPRPPRKGTGPETEG
jgi:putative N6-adenine-specific DNA methylase